MTQSEIKSILTVEESRTHLAVEFTEHERSLGMAGRITRRDLMGSLALGAGASLLLAPAPGRATSLHAARGPAAGEVWTGYGGVGDFAKCNGNTWEVTSAGHGVRDESYEARTAAAPVVDALYDLVVVGGGFAGVIAAYTYLKQAPAGASVLLLDNHPLIGGVAKRNEFVVDGERLIAGQGSHATALPRAGWSAELWKDLGLPTSVDYSALAADRKPMAFLPVNFPNAAVGPEAQPKSYGYRFDTPHAQWVGEPWSDDLRRTPWPEPVKADLLRWRDEPAPPFKGSRDELERWLDTMTYAQYLVDYRKFHPDVAIYADRLLTSEGVGSDVLSACLAYRSGRPGFRGLLADPAAKPRGPHGATRAVLGYFAFPGGNEGIMRAIVKALVPDSITGDSSFEGVHDGRLNPAALDRSGQRCRIRTGATIARVDHSLAGPSGGQRARVVYARGDKMMAVEARAVVWAAASWSGKHVIHNLPDRYRTAMNGFIRSPALIVNVALHNWRALYDLGYSSCSWEGGFSDFGNIRAPARVGSYRPPLDPDKPAVFTMKKLFAKRGLPLEQQVALGRAELFSTSYRGFELQVREQLNALFGSAGFDPGRDIAGIILNRWGHAFLSCGPGFFHGTADQPSAGEVLRRPLGNLHFAHSELQGVQSWIGAGDEGVRAAHAVLAA